MPATIMANPDRPGSYPDEEMGRGGFNDGYRAFIEKSFTEGGIVLQKSLSLLAESQNQLVAQSAKIVIERNPFEFNAKPENVKYSIELTSDEHTPHTAFSVSIKEPDISDPLGEKILAYGLRVYLTRQEMDNLSNEELSILIRPSLARTVVLLASFQNTTGLNPDSKIPSFAQRPSKLFQLALNAQKEDLETAHIPFLEQYDPRRMTDRDKSKLLQYELLAGNDPLRLANAGFEDLQIEAKNRLIDDKKNIITLSPLEKRKLEIITFNIDTILQDANENKAFPKEGLSDNEIIEYRKAATVDQYVYLRQIYTQDIIPKRLNAVFNKYQNNPLLMSKQQEILRPGSTAHVASVEILDLMIQTQEYEE